MHSELSVRKFRSRLILFIILVAGAVLRLINLSIQSLWLDELYTMNEADPNNTWAQLLEYTKTNQHPPLFMACEHLFFTMFGYNEWGARFFPALLGIATIWAVYLLGKEILNERLGLIAAAITCVNYFNIFYSQEARDYSLLWFTTTLSYTFFLRLYKCINVRNAILYVISTVILLYSHYFSMLVMLSQFGLFIVFWLCEREHKKKLLIVFLISAICICLCYLPWIPYLMSTVGMTSFWASLESQDFYVRYFYTYFGDAYFLVIFLNIFLISYLINIINGKFSTKELKKDPQLLSFVFIFFSVLISYLIPYIRSVVVVPMIIPRYMVIVIPALIICLSYGVYLIKSDFIRYTLLVTFLVISLLDLTLFRDYYNKVVKAQFREMTEYISSLKRNFPVINELTPWQQQYYLKKYNYTGPILRGSKTETVDKILRKDKDYNIDTFWIVGGHGDPKLDEAKKKQLDTAYTLVTFKDFTGAWAELYARKPNK